jgi:hypothetical protein
MRPPRRLPGFAFETQAPPLADTLPRMDIAVFAGFAAAGPLHWPVAVEDGTQFAELFGPDLDLAFDPERNADASANLGPCVRSFFRHGGKRCWVIRVADAARTETSRFAIPGLYAMRNGRLDQAFALTRCPGSWADNVETSAELQSTAIGVSRFDRAQAQIELAVDRKDTVSFGDLLRLHWRVEKAVALARVASVDRVEMAPGTRRGAKVTVTVANPVHSLEAESDLPEKWSNGLPFATGLPDAERLSFDLVVREADSSPRRVAALGFTPDHPRYWAKLPDDAELYAGVPDPLLAAAATNPRFALAGERPQGDAYLPIGMPLVSLEGNRAVNSGLPALVRDGLAEFNSRMFFDPALGLHGVLDLMAEADFVRYQSPTPRPLVGIHAALSIGEATLIAVPDAVHRGWDAGGIPQAPKPDPSDPLPHPEWWHFEPCSPAPIVLIAPEPSRGNFLDCNLAVLQAPVLEAAQPTPEGTFTLHWNSLNQGDGFVLEEALHPDWSDAAVIYTGVLNRFHIAARKPGAYYYRVRVTRCDVTSNWSNGILVAVSRASQFVLRDATNYDAAPLLEIQRALLRMSAARGDLLAVLSLPEHFREDETLTHAAKLTDVPDGEEKRALSYGALYHSWLIAREDENIVSLPPDGAACGVMAARTLLRGAWIAPANQPLIRVVALNNALARDRWLDLMDAQVNVARQDPHGFLWMSADTLSAEPDVRPINVRRLMILLRRLALQHGNDYVFEPNDESFSRTVKHSFESLLMGMYDRGAFAGDTPDSSFQVVTDSTVNTPQTRDQGRFYVELKVAPSLPLQFLTVRLAQTVDRAVVTEAS